jgi:hypothetical protein
MDCLIEMIWTLEKLSLIEVELYCGLCQKLDKYEVICLKCAHYLDQHHYL